MSNNSQIRINSKTIPKFGTPMEVYNGKAEQVYRSDLCPNCNFTSDSNFFRKNTDVCINCGIKLKNNNNVSSKFKGKLLPRRDYTKIQSYLSEKTIEIPTTTSKHSLKETPYSNYLALSKSKSTKQRLETLKKQRKLQKELQLKTSRNFNIYKFLAMIMGWFYTNTNDECPKFNKKNPLNLNIVDIFQLTRTCKSIQFLFKNYSWTFPKFHIDEIAKVGYYRILSLEKVKIYHIHSNIEDSSCIKNDPENYFHNFNYLPCTKEDEDCQTKLINEQLHAGYEPYKLAQSIVKVGNIPLLKWLLLKKPKLITDYTAYGKNSLSYLAATNKHEEMLKYLISIGDNISNNINAYFIIKTITSVDPKAKDEIYRSIVDKYLTIDSILPDDQQEIMKKIATDTKASEWFKILYNKKWELDSNDCFESAAKYGVFNTVEFLMENNTSLVLSDISGYIFKYGNLPLLKSFLKTNTFQVGEEKKCVLKAIKNNHTILLGYLIEEKKIKIDDPDYMVQATHYSNIETITFLLNNECPPIFSFNTPKTILTWLEFNLPRYEKDTYNWGQSPMVVLQNKQYDFFKWMLSKGLTLDISHLEYIIDHSNLVLLHWLKDNNFLKQELLNDRIIAYMVRNEMIDWIYENKTNFKPKEEEKMSSDSYSSDSEKEEEPEVLTGIVITNSDKEEENYHKKDLTLDEKELINLMSNNHSSRRRKRTVKRLKNQISEDERECSSSD